MDEMTQETARQVVVHQIGDVRITLDMPKGMANPDVRVSLHTLSASSGERLAALEAFGMTDEDHLHEGGSLYWYSRFAEGNDASATVFFERPAGSAS